MIILILYYLFIDSIIINIIIINIDDNIDIIII